MGGAGGGKGRDEDGGGGRARAGTSSELDKRDEEERVRGREEGMATSVKTREGKGGNRVSTEIEDGKRKSHSRSLLRHE